MRGWPTIIIERVLMKFLDLFSGVGMYAKGLEGAGHEVIGFCERDEFCQKILKKHWPMKPVSLCVKSLTRALMASLAAGRAKTYHGWDSAPAFQDCVLDYGGISLEPFAWYSRKKRCWKTWQRCLLEEWAEYLGTWPPSGMTQNGIAYALPMLDYPMRGKGFIRLPTLTANEGKGAGRKRYRNSPEYRGAKMSEGLRTCLTDPIYTNPNFAEAAMGLDKDWTLLETETRQKS